MILGLIVWYLFGVITYLAFEKIARKQVTVGEFLLSFFFGLVGPILLLVVILVLLVKLAQEAKFFDKKVF
jgi:hypothetical protein